MPPGRFAQPWLPASPLEMKNRLKVKISIVLSVSILINVFLIWEVFRLREENGRLKKERIERVSPEHGSRP